MAYQSLADLGHAEEGESGRSITSAVDVLREMKAMRPDAQGV
jgi:hypothetical protein